MPQQIPAHLGGGAVDLSHLAARGQQSAVGQAGQAGQAGPATPATGARVVDVPSLVLDLSDQGFEQFAQLSAVVPAVIYLRLDGDAACAQLDPVIDAVIRSFEGHLILARVDITANPGLAQALQAQTVPTVVALVAGRPVPLFQGAMAEPQLRELCTQLLQLAAQQGVQGRVNAPDAASEGGPAEPPVNPAHAEALAAIEQGDFAAAVQAYEQVLAKAPADHEARAALLQLRLLLRLEGADADAIRAAAAAGPEDIDAQLGVADLDVSGGHVEDAFLRLLDCFAQAGEEDRTRIRERLLELFEVVGQADPRVSAARTRLANLLY